MSEINCSEERLKSIDAIRGELNQAWNNVALAHTRTGSVRDEDLPKFLAAVEQLKLTTEELLRGIDQSNLATAVPSIANGDADDVPMHRR